MWPGKKDCPIRLTPRLAPEVLGEIRRTMELSHCKWDAQVGDVSSLAPFALVVDAATWRELASMAEALAAETALLETALLARPDLHAAIALPRRLRALLAGDARPTPAAARVLRFDFHWTTEGWRISEVNSDVPGGYTEATSFTRLVAEQLPGLEMAGDPVAAVVAAIAARRDGDGIVSLTNAPGHMEDHQVVAYLAARLREHGIPTEHVAPAQLGWREGRAYVGKVSVSAVFRFYQVEWLARLPRAITWEPLFVGARTPVANPGTSALTESKRLPLVWDRLGVAVPTWRRLLPETRALGDAPWTRDDGWLVKTAYSNTGDTVSIREALPPREWQRRSWAARLRPGGWLAQRRFEVVPLLDDEDRVVPCIGVYTVDGRAAGAYARVARSLVTDAFARDAALLVSSS